MSVMLGSGEFSYAVAEGWGKLPDGWSLKEVAGIGIDHRDRVYVFNRGAHPMIVFDRDGNFLASWGEGLFQRAHGIHMGPDESIYCTDDGDHTVRKCSLDGKVLLTIGVPDKPSPYMSGEPFHRCTHTALSPNNEIYVSDGYGNARVHKFSPAGKLLMSWGEPGTDPGQFNIVHNVCCDADGWVYVADRENHRVQVFDVNRNVPNLGPRLSIVSHEGKILARLGALHAGIEPGQFIAPHGIAVDSRGDIYVGEVSWTAWPQINPDEPRPEGLRSLQKLIKAR